MLPMPAFAHPGRYEARLIDAPSGFVELAPGESKNLTIKFKNIGDHFWNNRGKNFVSLYTWNPKYRKSAFQHPRWYSARQPGLLLQNRVNAGETGSIELPLKAPTTPGTHEEQFALAAEDLKWIPGGIIKIKIKVGVGTASAAPPSPTESAPAQLIRATSPSIPAGTRQYQAQLVEAPGSEYKLRGSAESWVSLMFKNTGTVTWREQTLRTVSSGDVGIASASDVSLRHVSWNSDEEVMKTIREVPPGASVLFQFPIKAPPFRGSYQVRFQLVTNGEAAAGSDFELPVTVTDDAPNPEGVSPSPNQTTPAPVGLVAEPNVRIGLYTADGPVIAMANGPANLQLANGVQIASVPANTLVTLHFDPTSNVYSVAATGSPTLTAGEPIRLVPTTPSLITLVNYVNPPKWNTSLNDNVFRGALEIRRASTGYTWIINELPMEQYLAGLAETSNRSHSEYHKAIVVAARTYAYFHLLNPGKHLKGGFTVDAYWDQVYRGYKSEERMPRFVASAMETRGEVVTHNGNVAVTYYFARSDGRTRGREEVWGGAPVPWLKSVPVPSDAGSRMLGHGIGMSATGAAQMAIDGQMYRQILPYFYTGTEIKKVW